MITLEQARIELVYDSATGDLRWRRNHRGNAKAGDLAGSIDKLGYRSFVLNRKRYLAHRVAWLMSHGEWPATHLDHINGERADNRLANLRLATQTENLRNTRLKKNRSGFRGVTRHVRNGKWQARIYISGKVKSLGYYHTPEEASAAYQEAARDIFGEFAPRIAA